LFLRPTTAAEDGRRGPSPVLMAMATIASSHAEQGGRPKLYQLRTALGFSQFLNRGFSGVNINENPGKPFQPHLNYRGYTASPLLGTPQGISVTRSLICSTVGVICVVFIRPPYPFRGLLIHGFASRTRPYAAPLGT